MPQPHFLAGISQSNSRHLSNNSEREYLLCIHPDTKQKTLIMFEEGGWMGQEGPPTDAMPRDRVGKGRPPSHHSPVIPEGNFDLM